MEHIGDPQISPTRQKTVADRFLAQPPHQTMGDGIIANMSDDLRYPIGKFHFTQTVTPDMRPALIEEIRQAPDGLRKAVDGLSDAQLEEPYRPGGWTVRQTIHHVADSHINSYVRFRLALTEEEPLVKGYDEKKWAELTDARTAPVADSLLLIDQLHKRWAMLLESMTDADWERTFLHPSLGAVKLSLILGLYAWHGKHHTGHITSLRQRMGWV